jgi:hypothetical protein
MRIRWTLGWMGEVSTIVPIENVFETIKALVMLGFDPKVEML